MQGVGCRVQGAGCRVQGAGCMPQGAGWGDHFAEHGFAVETRHVHVLCLPPPPEGFRIWFRRVGSVVQHVVQDGGFRMRFRM